MIRRRKSKLSKIAEINQPERINVKSFRKQRRNATITKS